MGSSIISWSAHQQKMISLSTCEAKYVPASEAAKEITWLCTLLYEIKFAQPSATPLLCDNIGGITLSEDSSYHSKIKHIDIRVHSICEQVSWGQLKLHYVKSINNSADISTKALPCKYFKCLWACLSLQWGIKEECWSICTWLMWQVTSSGVEWLEYKPLYIVSFVPPFPLSIIKIWEAQMLESGGMDDQGEKWCHRCHSWYECSAVPLGWVLFVHRFHSYILLFLLYLLC